MSVHLLPVVQLCSYLCLHWGHIDTLCFVFPESVAYVQLVVADRRW